MRLDCCLKRLNLLTFDDMSLYDIMNKKPVEAGRKARGIVEQPVEPVAAPVAVAEEKAPVAPVQTAPVQEAPQAVQTTPQTTQKKPYTHWWQTPEYLGEVNRRAADAEKRAEQDRKRAVRQRNAAILGDLAKLGAQMYAKAGGATRVDQFTPATEKANDKLAALRERHAAEVAAFAKERAAARQAQIADNNARMKLETSLAEADAERKRREAKEKADQEYRDKVLENERKRIAVAEKNAETAAANAAVKANKTTSNEQAEAIFREYQEMVAENPGSAVMKKVPRRDKYGNYIKNDNGEQVYDYVPDPNPSVRAAQNAIQKHEAQRGSNDAGIINSNNAGII